MTNGLTFPLLEGLKAAREERTCFLKLATMQVMLGEQCPDLRALAELLGGSLVLLFGFLLNKSILRTTSLRAERYRDMYSPRSFRSARESQPCVGAPFSSHYAELHP